MTNMIKAGAAHNPTVRQLLQSETMAEAQVVFGEDLLERYITQVISSLNPPPRAGSFVVLRADPGTIRDASALRDLAAVTVIRTMTVGPSAGSVAATAGSSGASVAPPVPQAVPSPPPASPTDVWFKHVQRVCEEASVPLIVMPSFGDPAQSAEELRQAFLKELKSASARLHTHLMTVLLDEGLEGLVEEVSQALNRPIVVESADFKVLASRNMGATPASQQHPVAEQAAEYMKKLQRAHARGEDLPQTPIKSGRRLILPVVLSDVVVGYVSAMVRSGDDVDSVIEYLQPATLATMVEFNQRRKDGSVFAVTQKSLLKDILSGRSLSASDQERLERTYGFDLCDGLLVFAVEANVASQSAGVARAVTWSDDGFITAEVEGTRVFVLPYDAKDELKIADQAQTLLLKIKKAVGDEKKEVRVQMGVARLAETVLDLPEAYREARQALVIGSMVHGDNEFITSYGDLGVKRLLYLMIDHPELERFYEENLAPLESYDAEWESELVPSLRVYLEHGANLNSAARALFIHRHTLRYRLEQIADILKCDIDSQEVLLNLQIAFLIADMKGLTKAK
ncbi:MAG TPA: helix-turn-helix domain-containing protein [Oculatellaceae cyanobacterium]